MTLDYLTTLRRIPDEIILSIATQDLEPDYGSRCICGWAIREVLAIAAGVDAEEVTLDSSDIPVVDRCLAAFGGLSHEWGNLFWDIAASKTAPLVEEAFAQRVLEAACPRTVSARIFMDRWSTYWDEVEIIEQPFKLSDESNEDYYNWALAVMRDGQLIILRRYPEGANWHWHESYAHSRDQRLEHA